jgi:hypothetical protein
VAQDDDMVLETSTEMSKPSATIKKAIAVAESMEGYQNAPKPRWLETHNDIWKQTAPPTVAIIKKEDYHLNGP